MTLEEHYRERYKSEDTPWDVGQPDCNLIEVVTKKPILSCKVLDIGCGTGDNSIWLAQNCFQVIGIDTSDIALDKAKEKASKANVECDFMLVDFLKNKIEGVLLVLYLTEAVFTHSVLKMSEEGLPKMSLLIWKKLACG
jgi:2-polyprenyl-3-methyl-5-hydroxy-6-metoxy-1,4-benzoquinol methylase